ncbi:Serine phosphatase RsbU, regulator of sigma subunit [Olavius algarvensis spirochete endosymbiont]|uniref:PP2C family protein-serine/threonine phosphatase n=1 Tax=Olavius algarvensis spirochete endosymbiont TaxID=260710 RepID=UPI000F19FAF4|nr:PP2C family serine/threonine-protein phosphatase [Olavius algarvensis spirochete endosymbiont]CAD7842627.1 MAG: hypothetical protein [Olavius algarvensis spirochete endosymbiont]VDA99137.1 Serine phosphatase RsbU, regulator of sigma subunit [Olavius algarvensis spirochete endosymbiont]
MKIKTTRKKLAFLVLLFAPINIDAQEYLFWDSPEPVKNAGRFPELVEAGENLVILWQEFEGESDERNTTVTIRAQFYNEKNGWAESPITVVENLQYSWLEEVLLYSVAADSDGRLLVAVASNGVKVYRQKQPQDRGEFQQVAVFPPASEYVDIPVAPILVTDNEGEFRIFFTRRISVPDIAPNRDSMLTIFSTDSADGVVWNAAEQFIDIDLDRAKDGAILDQNFLPAYLSYKNQEYVVFQTQRAGVDNLVYQLYLKLRSKGEPWAPAIPITEEILPRGSASNPQEWDNQRPSLGIDDDGEILVTWERRKGDQFSEIAAAVLGSDGKPKSSSVETVSFESNRASFSSKIVNIKGRIWFYWFDSSGIRIALREASADPFEVRYQVQAAPLNSKTRGADQNSASFPKAANYRSNTYFLWEDRSGRTPRVIFLKPDLHVDTPRLRSANFDSFKPGNSKSVVVEWDPPEDSSGILSYSWRWSKNPNNLPSIKEEDQIYNVTQVRKEFDENEDEGELYFTLIAKDMAGNWSEPLRLTYTLDLTPPPPPVIRSPSTRDDGFLESNTFTLAWDSGEIEPAAYYRWRMARLASSVSSEMLETLDQQSVLPVGENGVIETSENSLRQVNIDNGIWAFSISAVDRAGNEGKPNTTILLADSYIPVTYISLVSKRTDYEERVYLSLTGRGFQAGGYLLGGIIDKDGQEPWDYAFSLESNLLRVQSDIQAEIGPIDNLREGTYLIGINHPLRGVAFWELAMSLDSSGNVKYGPYDAYTYEPLWTPLDSSARLSGNRLLLGIVVLLCAAAIILTIIRLVVITREAHALSVNAEAILNQSPLITTARKEIAMLLKRKGMGLQAKFSFAFTLMVLLTILMIAVVLGAVWVSMERDTLAEGLENESHLLTETLSSSAETSILTADRGSLLLLPDRIDALPDALWTTVTGPRGEIGNNGLRATSDGYDYIWATNDPNILNKLEIPKELSRNEYAQVLAGLDMKEKEIFQSLYELESGNAYTLQGTLSETDRGIVTDFLQRNNLMPQEVEIGFYALEDELSSSIQLMKESVLEAAQDADLDLMLRTLGDLRDNYNRELSRILPSFNFSDLAYVEAEDALAAQRKLIENVLLDISNQFFSVYPEFNADALRSDQVDSFIFYKPILYIDDQTPDIFKGIVRLAVSVEDIRTSLARVQRRILLITLGASIASLVLGIIVALFVSSLMLKPIQAIIRGVSSIRDQPNMLEHESFEIVSKSKDELSELVDTINGMVRGLFNAALEQKELIAGQEIQKTFLPLEQNEHGIKLSTGGARNPFFHLFGYYEGADAVSGDYFDFRQLDEEHYVMIKLDISGHGVTASLIMVQIAALYVDYFRKVRESAKISGRLSYDLRNFTFGINDLINEVGFQGRFAAFNLSVINVRTSEYEMIHAGDNLVHIFDGKSRKMKVIELPEAPATGQIDSSLIEMKPAMYSVIRGKLNRGDILFLYTDGIEEAHHIFRNERFEAVSLEKLPESVREADARFIEEGYKSLGNANEEFDSIRINQVIEAAMNRQEFILERRCDLTIGKPLHFDFSTLRGNGEDTVLAIASVEKVFRIVPDKSGELTTRVRVDRKIATFLRDHFLEYNEFYNHPVEDDGKSPYVYFSHLQEDPQDDDLTLWTYECL